MKADKAVRPARNFLALVLMAFACLPANASATQSAQLHVDFTPERLGHGTTIRFMVQIHAPEGRVPSPLTSLELRYPGDLGVAASGLGLSTCTPSKLELLGPEGCPADSRMGRGSALTEIPIGPEIVQESASIAIVRAPEQEGHLALLFYADSEDPVETQIVFPGVLLSNPLSSDESILLNVPLVPSLPGAPDVAVVTLSADLGPQGLTYYEHTNGHLVAYRPQGILLPSHCPHAGFAFSATFAFLDGSHTSAHNAVPCPARPRH